MAFGALVRMGREPALDVIGLPRVGSAFAFVARELPDRAPTLFLFASNEASLPLGNGCSLHVLPILSQLTGPVADAAHEARLPLAVPNQAAFIGA